MNRKLFFSGSGSLGQGGSLFLPYRWLAAEGSNPSLLDLDSFGTWRVKFGRHLSRVS